MSTEKGDPRNKPEYQFVELVSRMLELPSADRVLNLRSARARRVIEDVQWRNYDGDVGSGSDLDGWDDDAETWGYSMDHGDASAAADAALRLLCKIAELPLDVRVVIE